MVAILSCTRHYSSVKSSLTFMKTSMSGSGLIFAAFSLLDNSANKSAEFIMRCGQNSAYLSTEISANDLNIIAEKVKIKKAN